ncbi:hypothetical protein P5G51_012990 [Virgibacillus sp. 179-BFC.A HS]|uniref:Uncharacterized protein n=1 Tax=Tigheibacillus jepli TaxID=3035914 RepID=A0ABU5CIK6_9BACI|nr:hypothetical protein [Virgibacillus sp. 179-BFC.A HS]MDY0406183.1 hypothetical protein [Virgibacillus sp. 179-BFC.A HS]
MAYAVVNWCSWIGFHFASYLLNKGETVIGIGFAKTKEQAYLEMFFGRNTNFHLEERLETTRNLEAIFDVGELQNEKIYLNLEAKYCLLGINEKEKNVPDIVIHTPLLVGEWMPMAEKGVRTDHGLVAFDSEEFHQALPIDALVPCLLQWLYAADLPEEFQIFHRSAKHQTGDEQQNVYIINTPSHKTLKKDLLKHYHAHPDYYLSSF